jgi:cytidylate kinase
VPFLLEQHKSSASEAYPSFDEAVDQYFSRIEDQKLAHAAEGAEKAIKEKVEKIKANQQVWTSAPPHPRSCRCSSREQARVVELEQQEAESMRKAQLAELYAEDVDKVSLYRVSRVCGRTGRVNPFCVRSSSS